MSKYLQCFIISLVLFVGFIGAVISCFILNDLTSLIIMILLSVFLFIGFFYSFIFALSFKVGKKIKASIINKQYIPSDNNKNPDNAYYKYTYQLNVNNKTKTRSFKIYCLNDDIVKNLNIGNEIQVNKFLFITSIDIKNLIKEIRTSYNSNDIDSKLYHSQKKHFSKTLKKELIIGLSILTLLITCCLIYVLTGIK